MKTIVLLAAIALASCASDSGYGSYGPPRRVGPAPLDPPPAAPPAGGGGHLVGRIDPGIARLLPPDRTYFDGGYRGIPAPGADAPRLGDPPRPAAPGSRFADPSLAGRIGSLRPVAPRPGERFVPPATGRIIPMPRPAETTARTTRVIPRVPLDLSTAARLDRAAISR
ncbi:hypothetical protein OKA04_04455 [Luteolibacter flavescens]|uniref:Uncharacterized protein n=1 Tax=Luteolibacter flavescens TaxID=1859460 RepID=A0ABT3FK71_9BACT|nr:hypothetical protein [Luteolibacter flavescens]MCW1883967.1 hypothetical protein [Luteolibacter flavescens]